MENRVLRINVIFKTMSCLDRNLIKKKQLKYLDGKGKVIIIQFFFSNIQENIQEQTIKNYIIEASANFM